MKPFSFFTFLLLSCMILTSCTKETSEKRFSSLDVIQIQGYYVRDEMGHQLYAIGKPDVKLGNESNDASSPYYISVYPNPCVNFCYIYLKSPKDNTVKQLWIVRAAYNDQMPNMIHHNGMGNLFVGGEPVLEAEVTGSNAAIDLSLIQEGYYRVYVKVDSHLLYDNLVMLKQ